MELRLTALGLVVLIGAIAAFVFVDVWVSWFNDNDIAKLLGAVMTTPLSLTKTTAARNVSAPAQAIAAPFSPNMISPPQFNYSFDAAALHLKITNPSNLTWALFTDADAALARAIIRAHQFPPNCSSVKYLILMRDWEQGLGSTMIIRANMLVTALMSGRTLVYHPYMKHKMPGPCRQRAPYSAACFWKHLSNCTPPETALRTASPANAFRLYDRFNASQYLSIWATPWEHFSAEREPWPVIPAWTSPRNMTARFWMSFAMEHLMRPANATIHAIRPLVNAAFKGQPLPTKYISVFVRQGDKGKEAVLFNFSSYANWVVPLAHKHDIRAIYLGTDSQAVVNEAVAFFGTNATNMTLHYINCTRSAQGMTLSAFRKSSMANVMLISLADLHIATRAFLRIGTFTSGWSQTQYMMALAYTNGGAPYFSLDAGYSPEIR